MKQIYETSHFSLERTIDDNGEGFIDFSVLDPEGFDLVEERSFGMSEPLPFGYDIGGYTNKLKEAKTEAEKDRIFYELYFLFDDIIDGYL